MCSYDATDFVFLKMEFSYLVHDKEGEAIQKHRNRGVTSRAEGALKYYFPHPQIPGRAIGLVLATVLLALYQ